MKITVLIKPNAKRSAVEKMANGTYRVSVNAPPIAGRANEALIAALAEHFKVPKSAVEIVRGIKGRKKIVVILPCSL